MASDTDDKPEKFDRNRVYIRLRPHNPRKGFHMKRFSAYGILIKEEAGWHKVDAHVAEYLSTVHARPEDPETPLAFDVVTKAEADRIERKEIRERVATGRASPAEADEVNVQARDVTRSSNVGPQDLSTADLRQPSITPEDKPTTPLGPRARQRASAAVKG